MRGDGSIYRRGKRWWISYYAPDAGTGRRRLFRESVARSAGVPNATEKDARELLARRIRERGAAELGYRPFDGPARERLTVGELLDALVTDYELNGRKSLKDMRWKVGRLEGYWGGRRAVAVTAADFQDYKAWMLRQGYRPASVNRYLSALARAFSLGVEHGRLFTAPKMSYLAENNARTGFWTKERFFGVLKRIREAEGRRNFHNGDVADLLEWFFYTAMRPASIRALTFQDLNEETRTLTLPAAHDKAGKGIVFPLRGVYWEIIRRREDARRADCPYIFHRGGRRMGDFRRVWRAALEAEGLTAGVAGLVLYDLRRTAINNMKRAGVPESVIMRISGHRTRETFIRYNITSSDDVIDAMRRTERYVSRLGEEKVVPISRKRRARGR